MCSYSADVYWMKCVLYHVRCSKGPGAVPTGAQPSLRPSPGSAGAVLGSRLAGLAAAENPVISPVCAGGARAALVGPCGCQGSCVDIVSAGAN